MNKTIEKYLQSVDNLSMLEPKNLPLNVLVAMSEMNSEELFKICTQLYVLQNNVPSKNNIINLTEEEILQGASDYAKEILERIQH